MYVWLFKAPFKIKSEPPNSDNQDFNENRERSGNC